jgi:hypothetical protein
MKAENIKRYHFANPFSSETGQALLLIVFGMVALLGFAALAIDGGMVYSDRRQAQNAADTAALAAALAKLNNQNYVLAARQRASSNGFDNNGATNWVAVHNPPISGLYAGDDAYIQVFITSTVQTSLVHFVYSGPVRNTVEAISRVTPGSVSPMFFGNAVVGLKPDGCSVVWSHGNGGSEVDGGGIFVNSNDADCAFSADGNAGMLTVPAPETISVVGGADYNNTNVDATVQTGVAPQDYPPTFPFPTPSCSSSAVKTGHTLSAGLVSGNFPPTGVTDLKPGVYCVTGTFSLQGGSSLSGDGVLIYMQNGGDITWNGGAEIHLSSASSGTYQGLLIYVDPQGYTGMNNNQGNCTLTLNGNENSTFEGTIYAPSCDIDLLGTGAQDGWNSQIVGYTVEMGGNIFMHVVYDSDKNYKVSVPPQLDMPK